MTDELISSIEPHHYLRASQKLLIKIVEYLEGLPKLYNEENVVTSVAISLGKIGFQSSLNVLREILYRFPQNSEIISSIGWYKNPTLLSDLYNLLKDPDYPIKDEVVRVIGEIGDIAAYNVLKELLKDDNRMVRYHASWSLYKIGAHDLVQLLIPLISDSDEWIVINALEILSRLREIELIPAIVGQFELSTNPRIKAMMISFLSNFKDPKLLKFFEESLNSYDTRIQANAIEAIGMLKIPELEIKRKLKKFYQHSNNRVKANTLIALHKIDKENVIKELENMVYSASTAQKKSAAYVLSKINIDNKEKYVLHLLSDPSPQVKKWALRALSTLNKEINYDEVISLLKENNPWLRREIINFAKNSPKFPAKPLIEMLLSENELLVIDSLLDFIAEKKTLEAKDIIFQKIKNSTYEIYYKYLWCISKIGSKDDIYKFKKLIHHSNSQIIIHYYLALLNCGDLSIFDELLQALSKETKREVLSIYINVCGEIGWYLRNFNNYSQQLINALYEIAKDELQNLYNSNIRISETKYKPNQDEIAYGIDLVTRSKYEEAIKFLKEYISFYPNSSDAKYYLALSYFKLGNVEESLDLVTQLLENDSSHALANLLLCQIYFKQKDWVKITKLYDKIKHKLQNYDNRIVSQIKGAVGLAYFHLRHFQKAINILSDSLNTNPNDLSSYYHLALCYYAIREYKKAHEMLKSLKNKIPERNYIAKNIEELIQKIEEEYY